MRTKLFALLLAVPTLLLAGPTGAQAPSARAFADDTWSASRAGAVIAQSRVHQNGSVTVPPPSGCQIVGPDLLPPQGGAVTLQMVCTAGGPATSYVWTGPDVAGQTGPIVTATINNTATFTAQAANAGGMSPLASKRVTVQVRLAPAALPNGTQGVPYSQRFSAIGGTGTYSYSRIAGTLPPGLSLTGDVLSGTPTAAGDYSFTIAAIDTDGVRDARVYDVRIAGTVTLTLAPAALPNATVNVPYSATVTASGGTGPYTFALTGTLPPNVTFSSQGVFAGTPAAPGTSSITVTATDSAGNRGSRAYTLTVNPPAANITLAPATLPNGTAFATYPPTQITASGGTAPYAFSVQGTLPPGLALSASGMLTGTPTTANPAASFTIVATDSTNATGSRAYTIAIAAAAPIVIAPPTLPPATVGTPYSQTFSATGGSGSFTFAVNGTLPAGLTLNGSVLSGTPTTPGPAGFTIVATDTSGATGTRPYVLTVAGPPATRIAPVSVRQQTGTPGQPLPAPVVVALSDSNGNPVIGAGSQLTAASTAAGDLIAGPTEVTGRPGQYAYNVTLGAATGSRVISVCLSQPPQCVTFLIGSTQQLQESAKQVVAPQAIAAIAAPTQQLGNIQQHLDNRRLMRTPSVTQGLQVNVGGQALPASAFALAPGRDSAQAKAPTGGGAAADDPFARWGFFVQGVIDVGKADATSVQPGFDIDTKGLTLGTDYRLDKGVVGAALGLTKSTSDLNNGSGDLDSRGWSISLFGSYVPVENAYIDLILNFGRNKFDTTRKGQDPANMGMTAEYNSSPRGDQFGVSLSGGYQFYRQALTLSPYARVEYVTASIDSFTESGGEGALEVSGQKYSNTVLTLGGLAQYSWSQPWGVLVPYGRLELQYIAQSSSDAVTAQYAAIGLANSPVGIPVADLDKSFGTASVGATAVFPRGVSGYFNYQYLFGNDNFRSSRYTLGLRVEF